MALAKPDPQAVIYMGIDFGTTYSCLAYQVEVSGHLRPEVNYALDASSSFSVCPEKIPTQLPLFQDGSSASSSSEHSVLQWFKLMILWRDDLSHFRRSSKFAEAEKKFDEVGQGVLEVTTIYFQRLWASFVKGLPFSVEQCKVHVTLTTPANWPHDAKQRMRKAIDATGIFNRLQCYPSLICEPEAAAVFLITYELQRINPKENDTIVVCDCGGGTADCVSFQVSGLSPLSLAECVPSEYTLSGAVILNDLFREKALIIAGGFGKNLFLQNEVNKMIEGDFGSSVGVIVYHDNIGWKSEAHGALYHAINTERRDGQTIVACRLSPNKYGFRPPNQGVKWFLEKGANLSTRRPNMFRIRLENFETVSRNSAKYLTLDLYSIQSGIGSGYSRQVCKVTWLWLQELDRPSDDSFDLGVVYDGIIVSFTLYYKGKLQGPDQVTFKYEY
ncbi:hypothetical protein BKA56DRAFT_678044 [Ilyonectria sp. MPI-CAGE-AT-0026]|nr:hypothetical protein BKA56DRAFT_678044 [Ilyonectria sp. MPI-CAGE-AT-0026]